MYRKTMLFVTVAALFLLCACSRQPDVIDGYTRANYSKYAGLNQNGEAAQNGEMNGALLFEEGVIREVFDENGHFSFVLENSRGQRWAITMGRYPEYCPTRLEGLLGKQVRAFFAFSGYSVKMNLPKGDMQESGKVVLLEGNEKEKAYQMGDFVASDEEYLYYAEQKSWKGFYFNLHKGEYREKYVLFTGLVTNVNKKGEQVSFYFSEKTSGKYKGSQVSLGKEYAETVEEGKGLKILGYVDAENRFEIEAVKGAEASATAKEREQAYMDGCEDTFAYMDLLNFHESNKGAYAKLKATVVEIKQDTKNKQLYYLTAQLGKGEYIHVSWRAPDDFKKSTASTGQKMVLYGKLNGVTEITLQNKKVEAPSIEGKYILFG